MKTYRIDCEVRQQFFFFVFADDEQHARDKVSRMEEKDILVHTSNEAAPRRTITIEKVELS